MMKLFKTTKMLLLAGSQIIYAGAAASQVPTTLPHFCNAPTPQAVQILVTHSLSCGFNRATMSYAGSPVEQARCLLRHVSIRGHLDHARARLPDILERLIGTPVAVSRARLLSYMQNQGVRPEDVGGDVGGATSKTTGGHAAAYFVIHDTSTPNYNSAPFPADINGLSWPYNSLGMWQQGTDSHAHIYIARTGTSATALDYKTPWRATKTESCVLLIPSRGLFLHNELVQPRRSDPSGPVGNDNLSPDQAFTAAQLDKLALAYVVASVRAGHWLIPAFHAAIDEGLGDGHDDPQGFDLDDWAERVGRTVQAIGGS